MTSTKERNIVVSTIIRFITTSLGIIGCGLFFAYFLIPDDFFCQTVQRVAAYDGTAYLLTLDLESNYRRYATENMGDKWYWVRHIPEQVQNDLLYPNPEPSPSEICDPTQIHHCYRISDSSNSLEYSKDSGQSWESISIPFRLKTKHGCKEPEPTSMVFVTDSNRSVFMVGMGTGGVIIRSADGDWSHHSIDSINNIQ